MNTIGDAIAAIIFVMLVISFFTPIAIRIDGKVHEVQMGCYR